VLEEEDKHFERDALQLQHMTAAAQSPETDIEFEVFAKPDCLLKSNRRRRHGTPRKASGILHHMVNTALSTVSFIG
jgi:hypothetical protein